MNKMGLRVAALLPLSVVLGTIWLLSSMSQPPVPEDLSFPHRDKVLHAIAYSGVGATAAMALRVGLGWPHAFFGAVAIGAAYGASDEFHQSFVPGRDVSVGDWLADVVGSVFGAVAFMRWARRR